MGRNLRTTLPQIDHHLIPKWEYLPHFHKADTQYRKKQKRDYDRKYRTSQQPPLDYGTEVWIRSGDKPERGQVVAHSDFPRSYIIATPTGQLRRNRSHLQVVPTQDNQTPETSQETQQLSAPPESPRVIMTRSQTGTHIKPPARYST